MSELKVYRDPKEGPCYREFYEKSEVDAVIEELKIKVKVKTYDIEAARKLNTSYLSDYAEALKREGHHKYKRCLAMAEICKDKIDNQVERDEHDGWLIITEYWERWHKRWLELAQKFKEAK